ncbi:MAG: hypothetical protein EP343_06080 [Deltaproteobacteria bacterium]|nr:MAG: hypothetical protein EP343_06080 [Deltaproteobacteria bacterium]
MKANTSWKRPAWKPSRVLLGLFLLGITLQWGCAKSVSLSSEFPKVRGSLPNEAESARREIRRLQHWIRSTMRTTQADAQVAIARKRSSDSSAGRVIGPQDVRPRPAKPVQPSPPPTQPEATPNRPVAKTMRRRSRRYRRLTPCQRLCRASNGICQASHRICRIATRFAFNRSFQVACRRSSSDCQKAQRRCRKCK